MAHLPATIISSNGKDRFVNRVVVVGLGWEEGMEWFTGEEKEWVMDED